jgi:hypothetical protein
VGRASLLAGAGLLLVVTGLLFTREAVDRQRVQKDIDRAAGAFAAAREANARELAPGPWAEATRRMDAAMAELRRQERRFVLVRSYPRVHRLAVSAIDAAEAASAAAAPSVKASATTPQPASNYVGSGIPWDRDRATSAINAAKMALDRADRFFIYIHRCPRAKKPVDVRRYLEMERGRLDTLRRQVPDLDREYAYERYADAIVAADSLKGQADPLCKDLEAILTKFKCSYPRDAVPGPPSQGVHP